MLRRNVMSNNRKKQSNFICDPDGPWGPVYDSSLQAEGLFPKYRFIDCQTYCVAEDEEIINTIQRLKDIFTQFKDTKN